MLRGDVSPCLFLSAGSPAKVYMFAFLSLSKKADMSLFICIFK